MSQFYLTLQSNSSSKYFKDNTLTKFTTKLHNTIDLVGEWEMALSEIIFPHNWMTLDRSEAQFTVSCTGWNITDVGKSPAFNADLRIPHGYYESAQDVIREVNKALKNFIPVVQMTFPTAQALTHQNPNDILKEYLNGRVTKPSTSQIVEAITAAAGISSSTTSTHNTSTQKDDNNMSRLRYSDANKHVLFTMYRNQSISFHPTTATILGIAPKQNPSKFKDEETYNWVGANGVDISRGISYIMVYCDLLEHVSVGDTVAPLLRIVNANGSNNEVIHHIFDVPRYIPVQKKSFDTIELDIRDDLGQPVLFESGKLVVTVHFKKAESRYFL